MFDFSEKSRGRSCPQPFNYTVQLGEGYDFRYELLRGSKNRGLEKSGFCFKFSLGFSSAHAIDYRSYLSCKNLASDWKSMYLKWSLQGQNKLWVKRFVRFGLQLLQPRSDSTKKYWAHWQIPIWASCTLQKWWINLWPLLVF